MNEEKYSRVIAENILLRDKLSRLDKINSMDKNQLNKMKKELIRLLDRERDIRAKFKKKKVNYRSLLSAQDNLEARRVMIEGELLREEQMLMSFNKEIKQALRTSGLDNASQQILESLQVIIAGSETGTYSRTINEKTVFDPHIHVYLNSKLGIKKNLELVKNYVSHSEEYEAIDKMIIGSYYSKVSNLSISDLAYTLLPNELKLELNGKLSEINGFLK